MKLLFALLVFLSLTVQTAGPAHSKTVWRCGEGGKIYSDSPCAGGRAVDVADPRSTADVQAARDNAKRQEVRATRMRSDRQAEEKRLLAANGGAANLGPSKTTAPLPDKLKSKAKRKPVLKRQSGSSEAAADGTWRAAGVPFQRKKD